MNLALRPVQTLSIILLPVMLMVTLVVLIGLLTTTLRGRGEQPLEPVAGFTVIVDGNPVLAERLESVLSELLQSQDAAGDVTTADLRTSVTGQPVPRPAVVLDI
jgi:hypothetical protein